MSADVFADATVLISGGAGFVGSNLVRRLLQRPIRSLTVVDNLLSAERTNLPDDPRLDFKQASIADDRLLAELKDDYRYVFHLATFHGNQNSIADPLADHANNTLTSLKLFDRLKDFKTLQK
ncbi:MAG: NAD-dependent epimerase/dehydratase family protein, partial [Candidatus Sericytochromatia bacterium]